MYRYTIDNNLLWCTKSCVLKENCAKGCHNPNNLSDHMQFHSEQSDNWDDNWKYGRIFNVLGQNLVHGLSIFLFILSDPHKWLWNTVRLSLKFVSKLNSFLCLDQRSFMRVLHLSNKMVSTRIRNTPHWLTEYILGSKSNKFNTKIEAQQRDFVSKGCIMGF